MKKLSKTAIEPTHGSSSAAPATPIPLRHPNGRFKKTSGILTSQKLLRDSKQLSGKTSQRTSTPIGRGVTRKRSLEEADDVPGKKPRKKLLQGNDPDASLFNSELSVIEQHDSPTKQSTEDALLKLSRVQKPPKSSGRSSPTKKVPKKNRKSFNGGSKMIVPQVSKKSPRIRCLDDSLLSKKSRGNEPPCLSIPVYRSKKVSSKEDSNANTSKSSNKDHGPVAPEAQRTEAISNPQSFSMNSTLIKSKKRLSRAPRRRRTEPEKNGTGKPANVTQEDGEDFSKHDFSPGINTRQRNKSGHNISSPPQFLGNSQLESSAEDDSSLLAGTSLDTTTGDSTPSVIDIMGDTTSSMDRSSYSLRRSHQQKNEAREPKMISKVSEKLATNSKVDPEPQMAEVFSPPKSTRNNKSKRTVSPPKQSSGKGDVRVRRSSPAKPPGTRQRSINQNPKDPASSLDADANTDDGRKTKKSGSISKAGIDTIDATSDIHKETVTSHDTQKSKGSLSTTDIHDTRSSTRKTQSKQAENSPALPENTQDRSPSKETITGRERRKTRSGTPGSIHDDVSNKEISKSPQRKLRSADASSTAPNPDHSPSKTHKTMGEKNIVESVPKTSKSLASSVSKNLTQQIRKMRNHKTGEETVNHSMTLSYILQKDKHRNQIKKKINDIVDSLEFASDEDSLSDLVGMHSSSMEDQPDESSVRAIEKDPKDASNEMDSCDDPDEIFLRQIQLSEEPSGSSLEWKSPNKSLPPKKRLKVLFPRRKANTSDALVHDSTSDSDVQMNSIHDLSNHKHQRDVTNGVIQPVPKKSQRRTSPRRVESKMPKGDEIERYQSPIREIQGGITLRSSRRLTTECPSSFDSFSDSATSTLEHPYGKLQVVVFSDTSSESQKSILSDSGSKDVQHRQKSKDPSVGQGRPPLITDPIFSKPVSQAAPQQALKIINTKSSSREEQPTSAMKAGAPTQRAIAPNKASVSKMGPPELVQNTINAVSNAPYMNMKRVEAPSTTNPAQIPFRPILPSTSVIQRPLTQSLPQTSIISARHGEHLVPNPSFTVQQSAVASAAIPVLSPVITHNYIVNTVPHLSHTLPNVLQQTQTIQPFTVIQLPTEPTVLKLVPEPPKTVSILLPQRPLPSQVCMDRPSSSAQEHVNQIQIQLPNTSVAKVVNPLPQRPTVITKPVAVPSRILPSSSKTHPSNNAPSCQPAGTVISSSGTVKTSNANSMDAVQTAQSSRPTLEMNQSKTNQHVSDSLVPIKDEPWTTPTVSQTVEATNPQAADDKPVVNPCSSIVKNEPIGVVNTVLMDNIQVPQLVVPPDTTIVKHELEISKNEAADQEASSFVIENIRSLNQEAAEDVFDNVSISKIESQFEPEASDPAQSTPESASVTEVVAIVKDEALFPEEESVAEQPLEDIQDAFALAIVNNTESQASAQSVDAHTMVAQTVDDHAMAAQTLDHHAMAAPSVNDHAIAPESISILAADSLEIIENTEPLSADEFSNLMEECSKIVANVSPMKSATQHDEPEATNDFEEENPNETDRDSPNIQVEAHAISTEKEAPKASKISPKKSKMKKKPVRKFEVSKSEKASKNHVILIPRGETARTIVTKPSFCTRHERIDSASLNHKKKKRWILNTEFESLYRKVRLDHAQHQNTNVAFITKLIERTNDLVEHASDDEDGLEDDEMNHSNQESFSQGTSEIPKKSVAEPLTSKRKKSKSIKIPASSKQSDPLDIEESTDWTQESVQKNCLSASTSEEISTSSTKTKKGNKQTVSPTSKKNSASIPVALTKRGKKNSVTTSKSQTPSKGNVDESSSLVNVIHEGQPQLVIQEVNTTASDEASASSQGFATSYTTSSVETSRSATSIVTTASELAKTTSMITELKKTTASIAQLAQTTTVITGASKTPVMSVAPTMMTPVVPRFLQATVDDLPPPKGKRISRVKSGPKPLGADSGMAKDANELSLDDIHSNNNKTMESRKSLDLALKDTSTLVNMDPPKDLEISKEIDIQIQIPNVSSSTDDRQPKANDSSEPVFPATPRTTTGANVDKQPKVLNDSFKSSHDSPGEIMEEAQSTEEASLISKPRSRRSSAKSSLLKPTYEKEPKSGEVPVGNPSSPTPKRRLRSNSSKSASLSISNTNASEKDPISHKEKFLKSLSLTSSFDEPLNDSSIIGNAIQDEYQISKKMANNASSKDHSPSSKQFSKKDVSQTESNVSRILKQIELRQHTDKHAADIQIPQMVTPDKTKKSRSRSNFNPAIGSRKSARKLANSSASSKLDIISTKPNKAKSPEMVSDDPKGSSKEQCSISPSRSKKKSKSGKNVEVDESITPQKSSIQKDATDTLMKSPKVQVNSTAPSPKKNSQRGAESNIIPTIVLPDTHSQPTVASSHAAQVSPTSSIPNTDLGYSSQSLSRSSSFSDISTRSYSKPRLVQKTLFDFNIGDRRMSAPPRPLIGANERRITRTIIIYDESAGNVSTTSDGACQTTVEDLERTLVRKISKSVVVCDSSCQTSDLPFTNMVDGTLCEIPLASAHTSTGTSPIKQPLQSTNASTDSPRSKGSSSRPDGKGSAPPNKSILPQVVLDEYDYIIAHVASNISESPKSSPVTSKKAKSTNLRKKVLKKSRRRIRGEGSALTSATESDLEEEGHQLQSCISSPEHSVVLSDVDQTVNLMSSPGYQSSLKLSEEMMSSADEAGSLPEEIEFGASTDDEEEAVCQTLKKSRRMIVKLPGLTPKKNQGSPEKRTTTSTKSVLLKGRKRFRSPENMEISRKQLMIDQGGADASIVTDLESDPDIADGEGPEKDVDEQTDPQRKGGKEETKTKKLRGRPCKKRNRGRKAVIRDDSDDDGDENSQMVKCLNCDKEFPCLKDLKTHLMMDHTKLYTPDNPEGIGDHAALKFILKKLGRLICSACGKTHRNIQYYNFHQKWCGRENETTYCELCKRMVQSMWLQQHYREHRNREQFQDKKQVPPIQQKSKTVDGKRQAAVRARTNLQDLTRELMMRDSDDSVDSAAGDGEYIGLSDEESSESDLSDVPEREPLYLGQSDLGVCKRSFGDNQLPTEPDVFEEIVQYYQKHPRAENLHKILLPAEEDWIVLTKELSGQFNPKYKQSVQFMVSQYHYDQKRKVSKPMSLDWSQSFVTRDQSTSYCGGAIDAIEWCPLPIFKSTNHYAAVACHMTRDQPIGFFNPSEGYSLIQIWSFGLINPFIKSVKPKLSLTLVHDYNIASSLSWCPQGTWQNPDAPVDEENVYQRLGLLAIGSVDGNVRIFSVPHPFDEGNEEDEEGSEVKPPKLYQPKPCMILKTIENAGTGACVAVSWQNTTSCDNIIAGYANGVVRIWNITATSPLLVSYTESGIKMVHPIKSFFAHSRPIRDVAWNPKDGNIFATSGDDKRLRVWRLDRLYKEVDGLVVGTPVTSLAWPLLECGVVYGKDNIYLNDRSQTGFHDCGVKPSIVRYSPTNHHGAIEDVEFSDWHNVVLSCDTYGAIKGARFRDTSFEDINIHAIAHREFSVYITDIKVKKAVKIPTEDSALNSQTNQSSTAPSQDNQSSTAPSQDNQSSIALSQDNQTSTSSSLTTQSSETPADPSQPDITNENGGDNHVTNTDQSTTTKKKVEKYDYHSYKETDEKCCLEFIDYPLMEVKAGRKKKISGKIDIKKLSCYPIESLRAISVSKNIFGSTWLLSGGEAGLLRLHNMSGVMADTGREYMEDKIPK